MISIFAKRGLLVVLTVAVAGCGHTLSFDQGRYEVRVAPLTAKAHKYEDVKVGDLTLSLDETLVPYEFRGDWATTMGFWPSGQVYANVMGTVYAHVAGHRITVADFDANTTGSTLAATLTRYGFQCGAPRTDAVGELGGVEVECEARRTESEVQKVRARELWEPEGMILQLVSWTVGSGAAPEAEKFWASLRINKSAETPSANAAPIALAALPVDVVTSHMLTRRE